MIKILGLISLYVLHLAYCSKTKDKATNIQKNIHSAISSLLFVIIIVLFFQRII